MAEELCPAGKHAMTGQNVYTEPSTGRRRCRECIAEYRRQVVIATGDKRKGYARWAKS